MHYECIALRRKMPRRSGLLSRQSSQSAWRCQARYCGFDESASAAAWKNSLSDSGVTQPRVTSSCYTIIRGTGNQDSYWHQSDRRSSGLYTCASLALPELLHALYLRLRMGSLFQEPLQDGMPFEEVGKQALTEEAEGAGAASAVDTPPRDEVSSIRVSRRSRNPAPTSFSPRG